jgi:putative transcriptional regulator
MKIPELTKRDFETAMSRTQRERIMDGKIREGTDITALRKFLRMTQSELACALGISVHTLRNWEQGHRMPDGPALALLKIAARHPKILRENLRHRSRAA